MRIKSELELLKPDVRKAIIEEVEGSENRTRKSKHYVRHMVYRDQTAYFVQKNLLAQFDEKTVKEMQFALTNVSLVRKVVDKLSRVYSSGVNREVVSETGLKLEVETETVQKLESELNVNTHLKTINRLLKLHRNCALYVKPCPVYLNDGRELMTLKIQALAPYLYDVVEDFYDRTKPMCYVLSNYDPQETDYSRIDAGREGRSINSNIQATRGDNRDQIIADAKEDEGKPEKRYIFWSDSYHFTCDSKGTIIDEAGMPLTLGEGYEGIANPVQEKPFINFSVDQDNSFWAMGGDDLSMTGILVNSLMTHINYIGVIQGYGQFYMKGKNIPRNVAIGPSKAIILEYDNEDPVPDLGFASANPNIQALMSNVEMQVALCLTTNNLSTSGVAMSLQNGQSFASGVALMIDKSESMEDVNDQRQVFLDQEPELWELIGRWLSVYQGQLDDSLEGLSLPHEFDVLVTFGQGHVIQTEAEKLANIEKRKSLGLNTMIELLQFDQPDLSEQAAEEKLKRIAEEKRLKVQAAQAVIPLSVNDQGVVDESNQDDSGEEQSLN